MQDHDVQSSGLTRRRVLGGIGSLALMSSPALAQQTVDLHVLGGASTRVIRFQSRLAPLISQPDYGEPAAFFNPRGYARASLDFSLKTALGARARRLGIDPSRGELRKQMILTAARRDKYGAWRRAGSRLRSTRTFCWR